MVTFSRRSVMRGLVGGAAVSIAIPTLDKFLNGNGSAYADSAPLPTRFGMYFWGLGLTTLANGDSRWIPKNTGADYDTTPELKVLEGLKHKVSVLSGFNVNLDGNPNLVHYSGHAGILTGAAPPNQSGFVGPSFDVAIADAMGGGTRFRSLDMTPEGNARTSYSTPNGKSFATPHTTPMQLYSSVFGEGFIDPNSDTFTPDPEVILRKSVLSGIGEQRQALLASVGQADRQRLDQYFTSVRELENRLAIELQKPAESAACLIPKEPGESETGLDIHVINKNNKLMADLTAMALACNQTKVFNLTHTNALSSAYLPGDSKIYHMHTHDEGVDAELGYQPISAELAGITFQAFADFLEALDAVQEGDGTLLDHSLVFGYTDTGYAKIHACENIPMFLVGGANGAHKAGQHIAGNGDPATRASLTVQKLMGLPVGEFGAGSMQTTNPISELIA